MENPTIITITDISDIDHLNISNDFTGVIQCELNGMKQWFDKGNLHRVDGPAIVIEDSFKAWFFNNDHHRDDGPAVEHSDGRLEWWICGNEFDSFHDWLMNNGLAHYIKNEHLKEIYK